MKLSGFASSITFHYEKKVERARRIEKTHQAALQRQFGLMITSKIIVSSLAPLLMKILEKNILTPEIDASLPKPRNLLGEELMDRLAPHRAEENSLCSSLTQGVQFRWVRFRIVGLTGTTKVGTYVQRTVKWD